ncbi:hypothetical protein [Spirosoma terrae]|uniref:Uncharacterized protein n=1 Tax=Spirosoma terrae TaxID=1968276 RepID=A0A6L9L8S5_9BACT|nr:hypothetical protein [Spirosoma terrae]NDU95772.1 hypothetical protein [Spirosoma terrae]
MNIYSFLKSGTIRARLFRLRTWWRANYLNYRLWRVTYPDGNRTTLLHYREAEGCQGVFGGKIWIDYTADY